MEEKIKSAIEILRRFEQREGYFLAFSGGKDSICCYYLLKLSGVKFEAPYSITTVDEPFVKPFIRKYYPDVLFDHPKLSMFQLIEKKGLPTRMSRFCCEFLKEYSGAGRWVITGVRKQESFNRSKKTLFELDDRKKFKNKIKFNIIIEWSENDVWAFITSQKAIIPEYYAGDCRSARGGCVGCPMASTTSQRKDFKKYPKYKKLYLKAIKKAKENGKMKNFKDENEAFDWWLSGKRMSDFFEAKKQTSIQF